MTLLREGEGQTGKVLEAPVDASSLHRAGRLSRLLRGKEGDLKVEPRSIWQSSIDLSGCSRSSNTGQA